MTVAAAITDIADRVGDYWTLVDRPDVDIEGQNPTAAIYRSGVFGNIRGDLAHEVTVAFTVPLSQTLATAADATVALDAAETLLAWLGTGVRPGDMQVWWEEPPAAVVDYDPRVVVTLTIALADHYPRR